MSPGSTPAPGRAVVELREGHVSRLDARTQPDAGGRATRGQWTCLPARRPPAVVERAAELREAKLREDMSPGPTPAPSPHGGRAARGTCLPARRPRPARRPSAVAELHEAGGHVSRLDARGGRAARGRRTCGAVGELREAINTARRPRGGGEHVSRLDAHDRRAAELREAKLREAGGHVSQLDARPRRWSSCARPSCARPSCARPANMSLGSTPAPGPRGGRAARGTCLPARRPRPARRPPAVAELHEAGGHVSRLDARGGRAARGRRTCGAVVELREADQHLPRRPRGGGEHVSRLDAHDRCAAELREAKLREAGGHVSQLDARPRRWSSCARDMSPARRPAR